MTSNPLIICSILCEFLHYSLWHASKQSWLYSLYWWKSFNCDAVDLMNAGATVILRNAKIDMFKGSMRLAVDKWGRVEVTEPAKFVVKEDNNLSLVEYELVNVVEESWNNESHPHLVDIELWFTLSLLGLGIQVFLVTLFFFFFATESSCMLYTSDLIVALIVGV